MYEHDGGTESSRFGLIDMQVLQNKSKIECAGQMEMVLWKPIRNVLTQLMMTNKDLEYGTGT